MGITRSHEYTETEWYATSWLVVVWVTYLLLFLGTLIRRTEPHIYVANWLYLAFIVTIAVLVLGNNTEIPVSIFSLKAAMRQNLGFAMVYNAIALPLAAFGYLTPLLAAVSMSGSSLVVTLNALRMRNAAQSQRMRATSRDVAEAAPFAMLESAT